jgi:hypothetical protein
MRNSANAAATAAAEAVRQQHEVVSGLAQLIGRPHATRALLPPDDSIPCTM